MTFDLVTRAQRGDHEAFELLARGAYHRLVAIANRILRDEAAADDAVQQTLVRVWRDLPTLRDPDRFDAWLYRLIVRACVDEQRQARKWRLRASVVDINASAMDARLDTLVDRSEFESAFQRLSIERRAVLVLHYFVGLSAPEVGAALGIPTGTVYSRLHYATREMRRLLEKQRERAIELESAR